MLNMRAYTQFGVADVNAWSKVLSHFTVVKASSKCELEMCTLYR